MVCPRCHTENRPTARFCRICGLALTERGAPAGPLASELPAPPAPAVPPAAAPEPPPAATPPGPVGASAAGPAMAEAAPPADDAPPALDSAAPDSVVTLNGAPTPEAAGADGLAEEPAPAGVGAAEEPAPAGEATGTPALAPAGPALLAADAPAPGESATQPAAAESAPDGDSAAGSFEAPAAEAATGPALSTADSALDGEPASPEAVSVPPADAEAPEAPPAPEAQAPATAADGAEPADGVDAPSSIAPEPPGAASGAWLAAPEAAGALTPAPATGGVEEPASLAGGTSAAGPEIVPEPGLGAPGVESEGAPVVEISAPRDAGRPVAATSPAPAPASEERGTLAPDAGESPPASAAAAETPATDDVPFIAPGLDTTVTDATGTPDAPAAGPAGAGGGLPEPEAEASLPVEAAGTAARAEAVGASAAHDAITAPLAPRAESADAATSAPSAPAAAEAAAGADDRATAQLPESAVPAAAPPAPGDPFPALQPGALVAGRYEIQQVLQTGPQRQTYLAADQQGYRRCWACGSRENTPGEQYCTDCGAQLTGRTYRLLETPPASPAPALPKGLLDNVIPGVVGIYDVLTDETSGRHYLVLEDAGGEPLAAASVAAAVPGGTPAPPSAERVLQWAAQVAERLRDLHAAHVVGCDLSPQSLIVLPDDRVVLSDPTACRVAGQVGDDRGPRAEEQADVQRVAAGLEQWYGSLPGRAGADGDPLTRVLAQGREGHYHTAAAFAAAVEDLLAVASPPRDLQLTSGRASDVGAQRQLNEDSLFTLEYVIMEAAGNTPVGLYVVADGMGGHDSGEVASSIAVRTIAGMLSEALESRISGDGQAADPDAAGGLLRAAILEANARINRLSEQRHSDMGTTVTMAFVLGNQATVANVGDSRTYLWRNGKLQQITQDHSLVARLVASGQLTAEEGRHFDRRNEIYRALGDPHLTDDEVDIFHVGLRPQDALLLCSDGLWEMVRDADMEQILRGAPDLAAAARTLVAAANRNGGEDNITVIIAQATTNTEE